MSLLFGQTDLRATLPPEPCVPVARVDAGDPSAVADALPNFLGGGNLIYQERPQSISWGWETYTYQLQFRAGPDLPASLAGPLILRIYSSVNGVPRARHEFAVQERLHQVGFPVPKPLLLHTDCAPFGGPFLLMERIEGKTLCHQALAHPWQLWSVSARMAELHACLHGLPIQGFPSTAGTFLQRRLDELRELIASYGLHGLQPGLDWLSCHRPAPWRHASVVHLDWHPLNLIQDAKGGVWALDWPEADVGDPHADVAMTLLLLHFAPLACRNRWEKLAVLLGRGWIAGHYRRAYSKRRTLDEPRLAYYRAWAILRRLAYYGRWLTGGPASTGSKEAVLNYLEPSHLDDLTRAFRDQVGVVIHL